jgi:hypothetical protein
VRADGIGDPQAGAEIVRILDAVEDEQEGGSSSVSRTSSSVTWRCVASTVAITP